MKRSLVVAILFLSACDQRDDSERGATVRVPLAAATTQPVAIAMLTAPPVWTHSPSARAAWYGPPNAPALLAISCEGWGTRGARLVIVRFAPADQSAEALFAIQGSRGILRLPVSAVKIGTRKYVWRGLLDAADPRAEALLGSGLKATVPGGGQLDLPPMGVAGAVVSECLATAAPPATVQTLPNRSSNPETSPADR